MFTGSKGDTDIQLPPPQFGKKIGRKARSRPRHGSMIISPMTLPARHPRAQLSTDDGTREHPGFRGVNGEAQKVTVQNAKDLSPWQIFCASEREKG